MLFTVGSSLNVIWRTQCNCYQLFKENFLCTHSFTVITFLVVLNLLHITLTTTNQDMCSTPFILKGPVHVCEQDNCKYLEYILTRTFLLTSMLNLYVRNLLSALVSRSIRHYLPLNERILFYNATIKPLFSAECTIGMVMGAACR